MKWVEVNSLESFELVPSEKAILEQLSDHMWLATRDDGTPIFVCGVYQPSVLLRRTLVWLVPFGALRPSDWRGIKRGFAVMAGVAGELFADVEISNEKAVRFVEHLGFTPVAEHEGKRLYKCQQL